MTKGLGVICPPECDAKKVPFNRRVRRQLFDKGAPTLLNVFAGTQRWKQGPGLVLGVELKKGADLLSSDIYGMILKAASSGSVHAALAGPPCRTSSACRREDDGGPRPVRSRLGMGRFGLEGNTDQEAALVLGDTILWFRTLLVFALLHVCAPVDPLLGFEHPADPASWAPSGSALAERPCIWQFPEMKKFMKAVGAWRADFLIKARLAIASESRPACF